MQKQGILRGISALIIVLIMGLGTAASAQFEYERFAGYLTDTNGAALSGTVTINRVNVTTKLDGYFELYVPFAEQYVINATAQGYVPHSQVYVGPGLHDLKLQVRKGQVFTIDTTQPVNVTDSRGSRILLPAGALVNRNGQAPTGPIQMTVHTYDLRTEEMVGDMSALDVNGQPVTLLSIGAVSVDFTDAAGNFYNLAPGKKATLSVLTDPGNPYSGPIPMWWYDTSRGLWIEEGQGTVQNGVATAQVSHFTVWNFDMQFSNASCVQVTVDYNWWRSRGYNSLRPLRLRVTVPSPWYSIRELTIRYYEEFNAIYNVGNNLNLQLDIWNATTSQWEPYAIVNSGAGWGSAGQTPPYPYSVCNGAVTLNGVPTAGKLTGQVRRQHRSLHGGVSVQVSIAGSTFTTTTDNNGNFSVLVPAGTGSARASLLGYLPAQRASVSATGGATVSLPQVTLLAGDVDGNLCVNTADTGAINSAVGTSASANDPRNINGDTWIYYDDLGLASFNGGLCGPMGW
jgi:hypothetical protein